MREYDVYLPMHLGDGRDVPPDAVRRLKSELSDRFGGVTQFTQENEGQLRIGCCVYRDEIAVLRVLTENGEDAETYFKSLRKRLASQLAQDSVLIVARTVQVI